MTRKQTTILLVTLVVVCLAIGGIHIFTNRTIIRRPTQREIEACAPYAIDWRAATGMEGTDKEIILSMCAFTEEKTIGEHLFRFYESDTLGSYLCDFQEILEITERNGVLSISYNTPDGGMVTLGYDDSGMTEKGIYWPETDTYYYERGGIPELWMNFRNGTGSQINLK